MHLIAILFPILCRMAAKTHINDNCYDPVFLKFGKKVYTYDYIEKLRKENLQLKKDGKPINNLIPQKGFQEKVLLTQADIKIVGGKRGGGKATSVNSLIVTPWGYRRLGDLKVGDIISDPVTGGMQTVIAIYEHPQKDLYEVTFDDGCTCECCEDHLWLVRQTGYIHKRRHMYGGDIKDDYRVWTFGMIKEWFDKQEKGQFQETKKGSVSKKHLVIPLCEPVRFTKSGTTMKRPNIDPYVIGALIGDGCLREDGVYFESADDFIVEQFTNAGLDMSHKREKNYSKSSTYRIPNGQIMPILKDLRILGKKSEHKFIPTVYKWGSIEDRWAVLQGLMDTDGTVSKSSGSFCSVSKTLAEDVQFVARSLGCSATLTTKEPFYKDKDGNRVECKVAYIVRIKAKDPKMLFRLPRKKDICRPFNGGVSEVCRRIVSYRYIGKKDARCITVDSLHSLYMVQDFIVTHNTWLALFEALPYMYNPDVNMYGFRKYEDDVKRGIWKSSKQVYRGFALASESYFEWKFNNGKGATMKMEHLAEQSKVSDRFRGVEMAYILIEELAEHTKENLDTLFALLASNRTTSGVKSKCVATCNPVGKSNKLRHLLDWYIDPETDTIIKERDGVVRYFFRYGDDVMDMAWGNSPEEVYENINVRAKIDKLVQETGCPYTDFITSLVFIEGDFADNQILKVSDPKYMNRIAARGTESTTNDIVGVWRDIDSGTSMLTMEDMERFFNNSEKRDGFMRASADVALKNDFLVLYAFDGHHVCDIEILRGAMSDDVIPFIERFLSRNGVRKENFTYDQNGLGMWLSESNAFKNKSIPFNNKSAPSDNRMWNNLKSECAEKFVKAIKAGEFSISEDVLNRKFYDKKKHEYTVKERLMEERRAIKRKDGADARFEIIGKPQMKLEVGHSPDFIEALFMVMHLFSKKTVFTRRGFENW